MVQKQIVSSEKTNKDENVYQDEPKLRFPEFNDNWETLKLGDFLEFISTNSFSRAKLNLDDGKVKNIHYGDIHTKYPTIVDVEKEEIPFININEDTSKFKKEQFCKDGDLIIADASEDYADIGKAIELINVNIDLVAGLHTILARDKSNKTATGFKGYLFLTDDLRKKIKINANGISVLGISKNNIANLDVRLPSKEEQEKISSFLRAIDKKIELLEKKYKNSLNLKNSIFENLLNRTYSFKNSSKNWEEIKLSSILKERKEFADKKSNYPHVTLSKEGILPKTEEYNRDFLVKDENKKYKVTHLNDICYNPANLKFGVITLNKFGSAIFSPIYVTFEVKNANTEFVAYNLIRSNFINKIRKYEEGTVYERMAVKPSDFLKGNILLPPLEEQEKISHILNNLNKQLILIQKEQELITSFKKSLLQKMFI